SAPERQLQRLGGYHLHRLQPQQRHRGGGTGIARGAVAQPSVELPAHPIGGSQSSTASSSAGGSRPEGGRSGSPRANRCAVTPSAPNLEATSLRDSAA